MADHQEASVTLPSDPASVSAARPTSPSVLAEWGLPGDDGGRGHRPADRLRTRHQRRTAHLRPVAHLHRGHRARPRRAAAHRCHRQPSALAPAAARRRPAGQRPGHGHHPLAGRRVRRQAVVRPTPEGGKTVWIALPWTVPAQPVRRPATGARGGRRRRGASPASPANAAGARGALSPSPRGSPARVVTVARWTEASGTGVTAGARPWKRP